MVCDMATGTNEQRPAKVRAARTDLNGLLPARNQRGPRLSYRESFHARDYSDRQQSCRENLLRNQTHV